MTTRRTAVGVIALVCLASAGGLWLLADTPEANALRSAVSRVGIVMAALWGALPRHGEKVAWERLVPVMIGTLVFVALAGKWFRYLLPIAIVFVLALVFLRPRPKRPIRR